MNRFPAMLIKTAAIIVEIVVASVLWGQDPVMVLVAIMAAVIGIGTYALELHTRLTNKAIRWRQEGLKEGLRSTSRGQL